MTTSVVEKESVKDYKGLVMGHAYTLVGVGEYNGERLVNIRNPWGSEKYSGTWSDDDAQRWTDQAKAHLNHIPAKDDGLFWVPLADFRQLFAETTCALY